MNLKRASLRSASVLLLALLPACLQAQIDYGDYTFIIENDLSVSNHINSAAIVGGDFILNGGNTSVAQMQKDSHGYGLMVYGDITGPGSTLTFHNSANYYLANQTPSGNQVVGADSTSININNPGTYTNTDPLGTSAYSNTSFSAIWNHIEFASNYFAGQSNTGGTSTDFNDMNSLKFIVAANAGATTIQNYYTLDLTQSIPLFNNNTQPLFTKTGTGADAVYTSQGNGFEFVNTSETNILIINVVGEVGATLNFQTPTSANGKNSVLWNFIGFDTINLTAGREFNGSIMATEAAVSFTSSQNLNGQVFAQSYNGNGGGEYHGEVNFFVGDLPPIPEPSTYALFGAGSLAGLALFRRRRQALKKAA